MKVLIVDDSRAMRMIIRRTLRQAGLRASAVAEAANGQEALSQVDTDPPDLILCDWNMPVMNGLAFLESLRGRGLSTPIGFVTSQSTLAMRQRALDAGATFFLAKPFTPQSMAEALQDGGCL